MVKDLAVHCQLKSRRIETQRKVRIASSMGNPQALLPHFSLNLFFPCIQSISGTLPEHVEKTAEISYNLADIVSVISRQYHILRNTPRVISNA